MCSSLWNGINLLFLFKTFFKKPVLASEDFSYYLIEKPGAFYFLGSGKTDWDTMLHDAHFNFNEDLIEPGSKFWLKIAFDRLLLWN